MEKLIDIIGELTEPIDNFSNDLFKCIANENRGNFVVSAASTHYALSMCAYGASEDTAEQIEDGLKLKCLFNLFYWRFFLTYLEDVAYVHMSIDSKIYVDEKMILNERFKNALKDLFKSETEIVNFTEPPKAVQVINNWCLKHVNHKPKDIIFTDFHFIDPFTTNMILVNIAYFNTPWKDCYKFPATCTSNLPFYIDKKKQKDVPMMVKSHKRIFYKELNDLDAKCVAIPYKNEDFFFVIIVLNEIDGLENLQKKFNEIQIRYEGFSDDKYWLPVNLTLPKFKLDTTLDLDLYLRHMGMPNLFNENANFTRMSEYPKLHIKKLLQKVSIDLNESGTGLASAEVVDMSSHDEESGPIPTQFVNVTVDRPFLFKITLKTKRTSY